MINVHYIKITHRGCFKALQLQYFKRLVKRRLCQPGKHKGTQHDATSWNVHVFEAVVPAVMI